jgi:hypothetical protein
MQDQIKLLAFTALRERERERKSSKTSVAI